MAEPQPMKELVQEVRESYIDREIKARLKRGDKPADICIECVVSLDYVKRFLKK